MRTFLNCSGIARLSSDLVFKSVGDKFCYSFSIVWNESKKVNDGQWQEVGHFFNCVYFSKNELQLKKGDAVYIEGQIKQERWQNEQGYQNTAVKIYADRVYSLMPKDEKPNTPQNKPAPAPAPKANEFDAF